MRLGTDPEVFLVDKQGSLHSVIGHIGADKWNPLQLPDMPQGFTLQEDNVALEFGVPPASSAEEFIAHIRAVMEKGLSRLPDTKFSKFSCTLFPDKELEHPLAKVFGCEPDYNAYTGEANPRPEPPHPNMRSAGGHIHVETKRDPKLVVRSMDLFLGVPSVLMDTEGTERRKLYGRAGSCRFKPYGVEYRTLSNFWIFEDKYIRWVWDSTQRAVVESEVSYLQDKALQDDVQHCINTGNALMAKDMVKEFGLYVC